MTGRYGKLNANDPLPDIKDPINPILQSYDQFVKDNPARHLHHSQVIPNARWSTAHSENIADELLIVYGLARHHYQQHTQIVATLSDEELEGIGMQMEHDIVSGLFLSALVQDNERSTISGSYSQNLMGYGLSHDKTLILEEKSSPVFIGHGNQGMIINHGHIQHYDAPDTATLVNRGKIEKHFSYGTSINLGSVENLSSVGRVLNFGQATQLPDVFTLDALIKITDTDRIPVGLRIQKNTSPIELGGFTYNQFVMQSSNDAIGRALSGFHEKVIEAFSSKLTRDVDAMKKICSVDQFATITDDIELAKAIREFNFHDWYAYVKGVLS